MGVSGATGSLPDHDGSGGTGQLTGFRRGGDGCVRGAALAIRPGWVRVTGEDRVRWLNGMVTNSIQGLTPGEGCFNFLLNAQGRIQGTAMAFAAARGGAARDGSLAGRAA